jgi:hypothetical protein
MPKTFDDMVSAIKAQLKKENSNLSDEELQSRAHAIATKQWQKMKGENPSGSKIKKENTEVDEDGMIVVGENVNLIIYGNIIPDGEVLKTQ